MIPLAHLERSSCGRVYWIAAMLIAFCFPGRGSATPIIQEVLYDGPGSDADDAFTELCGTPGENLDGWALVGVNGGDGGDYRTVDLSGALFPADGILVIATSSAAGEVLLQRDLVGSVDWQNGPDTVQLRDPGGTVVDALQYGDAGAFSAGEGAPTPRVAAGESLSRDSRLARASPGTAPAATPTTTPPTSPR